MTEEEWRDPEARCLGMFLAGQGLDESDQRGRKLGDENFLVLLNAHHEDMAFTLPTFHPGSRWVAWMDTSHEDGLRTADTPWLQWRSLSVAGAFHGFVLMERLRRLMERKNEKRKSRMKRRHKMPFGAECLNDGSVRFRLWAPAARRVDLSTGGGEPFQPALPLRAHESKGLV